MDKHRTDDQGDIGYRGYRFGFTGFQFEKLADRDKVDSAVGLWSVVMQVLLFSFLEISLSSEVPRMIERSDCTSQECEHEGGP